MPLPHEEIGRRIHHVRKEIGISDQEMAVALGVGIEVVRRLEEGTLQPIPGDYILIIAQLLKTDFRYFISRDYDDVEEGVRKLFRALADPKPSDLRALRRFILFSACESELEFLLEIKKPPLPPAFPTRRNVLHKEQGRMAALDERKRLGLGNAPILDIFDLIRSQGIGLTRQRMEDGNLSGTTILHPRAGPYILINYDDDLYRQFFSAAHEYCHVLFDREALKSKGCVVSYRQAMSEWLEVRANNFASEFLLPLSALERYSKPKSPDDVLDLVMQIGRDYRVNTQTVAIRLKEKQWISQRTVESFLKVRPRTIPLREKRDPEIPNNLTSQQAQRRQVAAEHGVSAYYLELLRRAVTRDLISRLRFAEMLDMAPQEASIFVAETGLAL